MAFKDPPIRAIWITPETRGDAARVGHVTGRALSRDFRLRGRRLAHRQHAGGDVWMLPTTTLLEDDDLVGAYGHHWVRRVPARGSTPPGVKSDLQICRRSRRGSVLNGVARRQRRDWKERILRKDAGFTLSQIERDGPSQRPLRQVLFADRKFPTKTGR